MKTEGRMKLSIRERGHTQFMGGGKAACWMLEGERLEEGLQGGSGLKRTENSPPIIGYQISLGLNPGSTILGKSHFVEPYFSKLKNSDVNSFVIMFWEHSLTVRGCPQMSRSKTQDRFDTHWSPSLPHLRDCLFIPGTCLQSLLSSLESSWEGKQKTSMVGDLLGVKLKALWAKLCRRWLLFVHQEEFDSTNLQFREGEICTKLYA